LYTNIKRASNEAVAKIGNILNLFSSKIINIRKSYRYGILALVCVGLLLNPFNKSNMARAASGAYCHFVDGEVTAKEGLLQAYLEKGNSAREPYKQIVAKHNEMLTKCRSYSWPQKQAIWLRLYPCDISPGSIDYVLDRIVNLGYNQVNLEVFYDSQVLLPPADNPTPWISVVRSPGAENVDLLQQAIAKGHERGLKVYAWLFTMNFGYTYAQRPDRQEALARNGEGIDSLTFVHDRSQAFIDPYNRQAQIDYYQLVQAVLKRQPDGILFDYVRYPRGSGGQSSVTNVRDLWIYGAASLQTLYNRATNQKGRDLIERYVTNGGITLDDVRVVDKLYPNENYATWQGRKLGSNPNLSLAERYSRLQSDLWYFTVAHAAQGVIDFLSFAAAPAQSLGIPAGAVFFPDANRLVGRGGFDSRLQPWDKFPASLEWHPMSYAICDDGSCIAEQVKSVLDVALEETEIVPALAGVWGKEYQEHPSLEVQMETLRKSTPEINYITHFAYSWQEPSIDRQRKSCSLQ
jgi:hypothetical protein